MTHCRVYWGSHGCSLPRGHAGDHLCDCTFNEDGSLLPHMDDADNGNVGRPPYYGPETFFYGEDCDEQADPREECWYSGRATGCDTRGQTGKSGYDVGEAQNFLDLEARKHA